ncbi:hypothetical protein [Thiomicrorhabdus sp. 6S3-12]|uniref:hypothetical protein n=1 Tax=Thiomicrorhabdus sp. 6S3-12 TaxID=2819681 RepID=UPI001AAD2477|nr:hypothetical protein [Thiomicrorhabdus sp. 6S3-12]MBO1924329.1 hypothetical protein [Thiomicrorhabdus sp. 6S3-12]
MKKISIIVMSFLLISFTLQTAKAESLAEKKQWYNELNQMVNDPNILWLPTSIFMNDVQFVTIDQVKRNITTNLLSNPQFNIHTSRAFLEQYIRTSVRQTIELSNLSKQHAKQTLLPQLAADIKRLESQQQNNTRWQHSDTRTGELSNFDFLESIPAPDYSAGSNPSPSDNSEPYYASCPKFNTQNKRCWPAYTNGVTGGNTYTQCCYYSGAGSHIISETPYLHGKKDGTELQWTKHSNSFYFAKRKNWKNGKLDGIFETYTWMPAVNGPFLTSVDQYSQGQKVGHSVDYKVSGKRIETIWFNGVSEKIYYYNPDGSLEKCATKDHATGRWRDCDTGKLW